ncbi:MAG: DapH/DapD/GlmU-related protein, partial [Bacteroidales bacterium]
DDGWIGGNCCINQGIHIGTHVIIGAGSVVTKDIPSYSVAVGNPAKIIKFYNFNTNQWERK